MIEIIVDGKTARENLFDTYFYSLDDLEYITPKNNEIRKYCEFLKSYYNRNKETNYLKHFFVMEINDKKYEKLFNYSLIKAHENFLFEFLDDYSEEEAFYFKLKYC